MCLAQRHNTVTPLRLQPGSLCLESSSLPLSHCAPINSLDPDQARGFVGSDLGPICLQRLSVGNTSRQRITYHVLNKYLHTL